MANSAQKLCVTLANICLARTSTNTKVKFAQVSQMKIVMRLSRQLNVCQSASSLVPGEFVRFWRLHFSHCANVVQPALSKPFLLREFPQALSRGVVAHFRIVAQFKEGSHALGSTPINEL